MRDLTADALCGHDPFYSKDLEAAARGSARAPPSRAGAPPSAIRRPAGGAAPGLPVLCGDMQMQFVLDFLFFFSRTVLLFDEEETPFFHASDGSLLFLRR